MIIMMIMMVVLFSMYGEYDGWLLGPSPGVNFGGVKNSHDGMCVHHTVIYEIYIISLYNDIFIIYVNIPGSRR